MTATARAGGEGTAGHGPPAAAPGWFVNLGSRPGAPRVFCFAYAGGTARMFANWQPLMGGDAEVVGVCMPGREHRRDEPACTSLAEFADGAAAAIATAAERPLTLFGHSLGAMVAFEVARRLRGLPALRRLVASGCPPPSTLPSARVVSASRLEGRAFAAAVASFGGLPPEVVNDADLRAMLLPGLKVDVGVVASYRYEPAPPLPVPVVLVNGRADPHVDARGLRGWRRECASPPREHWVDGDHLHVLHRPTAVVEILRELVADDAAAPGTQAYVEVI